MVSPLQHSDSPTCLPRTLSPELMHWPQLSTFDFGIIRSPGPGFGNLLFPIARALIGQKKQGGAFVFPTMRQLKIGTFLRGERDKRTYGGILRTRTAREWVDWLSARHLRQVSEDAYDTTQTGVTVRYSGLRGYFYDLVGQEDLIAAWLRQNVKSVSPEVAPYDIGIHVRLGDFSIDSPSSQESSIRLPMEWYRRAFAEGRAILAARAPEVVLFTDGNPGAVKDDLGLKDIAVDSSRNAVEAITNLSRARLLIASRSTFSMWAAYLGGMPAIWDRNFDLGPFFPLRDDLDFRV